MLKGIRQTDTRLLEVINKYGCLFLCFAEQSPIIFEGSKGCAKLNSIWSLASSQGYISDDINKDGDFDDVGEAEIIDHSGLARDFFDLEVRYDGKHHDASEPIPDNVAFVFGRFVYKGGHFVIINKYKEVTFDSFGLSNTVTNGKLESTRWYYAI